MCIQTEILYFVLFSFFSSVCCFQFKKNNVTIKYEITNFKGCVIIPDSLCIFKATGLSLNECVSSCTFRSTCNGLIYRRESLLCKLYSGEFMQEHFGNCVYIKRSDIVATYEIPDIDVIQNCEKDVTCSVQECSHVEVVGGKVWGNMNSFGSDRTFECNNGYNLHGSNSIKCLTNKTWVPYPVCWKECRGPILHNCDIEAISGGQQQIATVKCHEGYASNRTSDVINAVTEEIVTCDKSGAWIPNIDCITVIDNVNKAWNKPARQSSTYSGCAATRATDGIWVSDFFLYACSHTQSHAEDTAWWEVDLQQVYSVRRIAIRNRKSAYFSKRLYNVTVTVGMSPAPTDFCAFYLGDNPPIEKIELGCNSVIQGRYVRLTKPNTKYQGDNLSLCEVGVYET